MIRRINEGFNSDGGYITVFDVNISKIAREVNDAIEEAVSYIDSGNAYPTWHWELGHDDEKMWCLVLGFMDGFDPNEDEFTDSYGSHLALKWGAISNRSAMWEFDMDFEMPYDEDTGDVWDSCQAVYSYDSTRDVKDEIEDFQSFAKQYNESLPDDFYESVRKISKKSMNERDFRHYLSNNPTDYERLLNYAETFVHTCDITADEAGRYLKNLENNAEFYTDEKNSRWMGIDEKMNKISRLLEQVEKLRRAISKLGG